MLLAAESLDFKGLNITHPYKKDAFKLMDTLSDDARNIGSINTIIFKDGKRHGDNTDWSGFSDNLRANLPDIKIGKVVLVGTGGVGLAVAYAMLKMGTGELRLFDTDKGKAEKLSAHLKNSSPGCTVIVTTDPTAALKDADGLINATPIGMEGISGTPVDVSLLHKGLWVADIVYFPLETELLKAAKEIGCKTVGAAEWP
jgi:shikimate dehydrogenase